MEILNHRRGCPLCTYVWVIFFFMSCHLYFSNFKFQNLNVVLSPFDKAKPPSALNSKFEAVSCPRIYLMVAKNCEIDINADGKLWKKFSCKWKIDMCRFIGMMKINDLFSNE